MVIGGGTFAVNKIFLFLSLQNISRQTDSWTWIIIISIQCSNDNFIASFESFMQHSGNLPPVKTSVSSKHKAFSKNITPCFEKWWSNSTDSVENDIIANMHVRCYFDLWIFSVYNVNFTSKRYGPKHFTRHINPKSMMQSKELHPIENVEFIPFILSDGDILNFSTSTLFLKFRI